MTKMQSEISLAELGAEYLAAADLCYARVIELRAELPKLSGKQHAAAQRSIRMLYGMGLEAKKTASKLFNYYQIGAFDDA